MRFSDGQPDIHTHVNELGPQLLPVLVVPHHECSKDDQQWAPIRLSNRHSRDNPAGRGGVVKMVVGFVQKHLWVFWNPPLVAVFGELCCEIGEATFEVLVAIFDILDKVMVDVPAHTCSQ